MATQGSEDFYAHLCEASRFSSSQEYQEAYERVAQSCEHLLTGTSTDIRGYLASIPGYTPRSLPHCGHIFRRDEVIFHCDDCAVDETCVLCAECFQREDHHGHRYRYYMNRGSGGSCDCGEDESWKSPPSCPAHSQRSFEGDSQEVKAIQQSLILGLQAFLHDMGPFFHQAMETFERSLNEEKTAFEGEILLVLFNDEEHSFDQVVDVLNRAIRVDGGTASEFAKVIDEQGLATVKVYAGKDYETACMSAEIIESIGLRTMLMDRHIVDGVMIINVILQWLCSVAAEHSFLLRPIIDGLLDQRYGLVRLLFQKEHLFLKAQRKTIQRLLTMALCFQHVKEELAEAFICNSVGLFMNQFRGLDREPHLTILQFAVQVFTVPSVVAFCCRHNLVSACIHSLIVIFDAAVHEAADDDENRSNVVENVVRILEYLIRDKDAVANGWLLDLDGIWIPFSRALLQAQSSFPTPRKTGEHVVFESHNWTAEAVFFLITLELIYNVSGLLIDPVLPPRYFDALQRLCMSNIERLSLREDVISFQQQALWLLGALLHRHSVLQDAGGFTPLGVEAEVARLAAHNLALLCQIKTGLWIRNGNRVYGQGNLAMRRYSAGFLYSTIVWHALASAPHSSRNLIFNQLKLAESAKEAREDPRARTTYFASILRSLSGILCASLPVLDQGHQLRAFVVHHLATGPKTFSQIQGEIPKVLLKEDVRIEGILEAVAECIVPEDCMGSSMYRLKSQCLAEFNQFYPGYVDDEAVQALEYLHKTHNYDAINQAVAQRYLGATYFQELFATGEANIMEELVRLILGLENPGQVLIDLLGILSLAHQANRQFRIRDATVEENLFRLLLKEVEGETAQKAVLALLADTLAHYRELASVLIAPQEAAHSSTAGLAEARRRTILAQMQMRQQQFAQTNPDATIQVDERVEAAETCEMAETGVCVLCQEPADAASAAYGTFRRDEKIRFGRIDGDKGRPELECSEEVLLTCFHLIHSECYARIPRSHLRFRKCPLCRFPSTRLERIGRALPPRVADPSGEATFTTLLKEYPLTGPTRFSLETILGDEDRSGDIRFRGERQGGRDVLERETSSMTSLGGRSERLRQRTIAMARQYLALHHLDARQQMADVERILRLTCAECYWSCEGGDGGGDNVQPHRLDLDMESAPANAWLSLLSRCYSPRLGGERAMAALAQRLKLHILRAVLDPEPRTVYERILDEFSVVFVILRVWLGVPIPARHNLLVTVLPEFITAEMDGPTVLETLRAAAAAHLGSTSIPRLICRQLCLSDPHCFVTLKDDYLDLLLEMGHRGRCSSCRMDSLGILCLLCGQWLCAQQLCFATAAHPHACPSSVAVRLDVRECGVVVMHEGLAVMLHAPYVDVHGETDLKLRRGNPLRLSSGRYRQLQILYLSGGILSLLHRLLS